MHLNTPNEKTLVWENKLWRFCRLIISKGSGEKIAKFAKGRSVTATYIYTNTKRNTNTK